MSVIYCPVVIQLTRTQSLVWQFTKMNSYTRDIITVRRISLFLFSCSFVICLIFFIDVQPFIIEFQRKQRHYIYETDISKDKEKISNQTAASNFKLESNSYTYTPSYGVIWENNSYTYATIYGVMWENNDSIRSSANKNVPSDTMSRQSSSATTNSVLSSSLNGNQIKSLGIRTAEEIELSYLQSQDSSKFRIENASSFDPVAEVHFFREMMENISRKEFNYSIFLNSIEKQNRTEKRNWLVRKFFFSRIKTLKFLSVNTKLKIID